MLVVKREQYFQLTIDLTVIGCYNLVITFFYKQKPRPTYQSDTLSKTQTHVRAINQVFVKTHFSCLSRRSQLIFFQIF